MKQNRHQRPPPRTITRVTRLLLLAGSLPFLAGCGIHYHDPKTGVEHLWGFGHLRMKVHPPEGGVQSVVKGYTMAGVKVGGSQEDYGVSLGYDSRRLIIISHTNAAFSLEWPNASFFNVRVGTNLPFAPLREADPNDTNQEHP